MLSLPARDPLAQTLFARLPRGLAAAVVRMKNVVLTALTYRLSRRYPDGVRTRLLDAVRRQLPVGYDVASHFSPTYDPWDQRLCVVPDGDLFRAVREGRASVVTDRIATLTERGVTLTSGEELSADVLVTATGLSLLMLGGATLTVDGRPVDLSRAVVYKGAMLSGVPNLALTFGYVNASWTPGRTWLRRTSAGCWVVPAGTRRRCRHTDGTVGRRPRADDRPALGVRAAQRGPPAPTGADPDRGA